MDYSVKAKGIPEEQQIFVNIWEHYKKFYKAEQTEEYWAKQIQDCNRLKERYSDSMLATDMLIAVTKELARKLKCEN